MSVLSDRTIKEQVKLGNIVIDPFDEAALGSNSYDVHLHPFYMTYDDDILDCKRPPTVRHHTINLDGSVLYPGELYLMATQEYTETRGFVPFLEGKSSLGRLGLSIHVTAGKGDDGFCNHWTMEVTVIKPTKVYAGMPIGQLIYHTMTTPSDLPYNKKPSQKYVGRIAQPAPSAMWRNFK